MISAPLGNDLDFPSQISVTGGSPQAFRYEQISTDQTNQRHEQRWDETNGTNTSETGLASLRNDVSAYLSPEKQEASKDGEWSNDFSLDERPGYSSQLIGLSSDIDPFLLRHYQYDARDTFRMFGLDFRKVIDDINMQEPAASSQSSQIPASDIPVQFAMTNEEICEEDVKIIDKDFSGSNTEAEDHALLYKIVPIDFGSRLLRL